MFKLEYTLTYLKVYKKKVLKNKELNAKQALEKTLSILQNNPFYGSLKTHKVSTKKNPNAWSSRITGDWRIVWTFNEDMESAIILCLELGMHSGPNQVYKNKSS